MANFTWKQSSIDRGLSWVCFSDGEVIGDIAFTYLPSNSGECFARNQGKGSVSVLVRRGDVVLATHHLSAFSRNEADKAVRTLIKKAQLRNSVEQGERN